MILVIIFCWLQIVVKIIKIRLVLYPQVAESVRTEESWCVPFCLAPLFVTGSASSVDYKSESLPKVSLPEIIE